MGPRLPNWSRLKGRASGGVGRGRAACDWCSATAGQAGLRHAVGHEQAGRWGLHWESVNQETQTRRPLPGRVAPPAGLYQQGIMSCLDASQWPGLRSQLPIRASRH